MATTESLLYAYTGGPDAEELGNNPTDNVLACDGNFTWRFTSANDDYILYNFNDLSIPSGATIDGIQVIADAQGNPTSAGVPTMTASNDGGSSWSSSSVALTGQFTKSGGTYTWGSTTELWGLSWTSSTAAAIRIKVNASTVSNIAFWDCIKVKVYYTSLEKKSKLKMSKGKINIVSGKFTIK